MNLADDGRVPSPPSLGRGPLRGVRTIEMGGLAPGPFAAAMLADLGADVIRVERAQTAPADFGSPSSQVLLRSVPALHRHPHNAHRGVFVEVDGIPQPAPVPRFGRTPGAIQRPPAAPGQQTDEVLAEWLGLDGDAIEAQRLSARHPDAGIGSVKSEAPRPGVAEARTWRTVPGCATRYRGGARP